MKTVFLKLKRKELIPDRYSKGIIIGPAQRNRGYVRTRYFENLLRYSKNADKKVLSLFNLALAVYVADKGYSRSDTADSWTRKLFIDIPIDTGFLQAIKDISRALEFLSGDRWNINARIGRLSVYANKYKRVKADAICLFSGGTDSLVGAINLLEQGKKILLVSHFESGVDAGIQNYLATELISVYGKKNVDHISVRVCGVNSEENSTRARSILFISLGLTVASSIDKNTPLYIPENGFIGINCPLTVSRMGSYSTRTTHPFFMACIKDVLTKVGINNPIINPLTYYSKGSTLNSCRNKKLLKKLLLKSISCSKVGWVRWEGYIPGTNCGFCYPCLIRRAAFHSFGSDNPDDYCFDAIGSSEILDKEGKKGDLQSILYALSRYIASPKKILFEILKSGSIPTDTFNLPSFCKVVQAGMNEIATLVEDKGCKKVKQYVGINVKSR